tara:strand:+ start:362 stop:949 length:588 start_codon:yes stop_codon:yes gene_type:complete
MHLFYHSKVDIDWMIGCMASYGATPLEGRFELLLSYGCTFHKLRMAGCSIQWMQSAGAASLADLRRAGCDTLWLQDHATLGQLVETYGATCVAAEFVKCPTSVVDAVGHPSVRLGLHTEQLLALCRGHPAHAFAALQVLLKSEDDPLSNVSLDTIIATGICAHELSSLKWPLLRMAREKGATQSQLKTLGYTVIL